MSKECDYCGFIDPMPFTCKFCGGSFCYNHRLPESHSCIGLARLKERTREGGKFYTPDIGMTVRREKQSSLRPVFNALSVITASYSLTIFVIVIISFFLQRIIPDYSFNLQLYPGDILFQPLDPLKLLMNLVTHIFLHNGATHLLFNMLFLYFFGPELERRIGGKKYLKVFFISGIAGGVGYVLWSLFIYFMFNTPPSPAVGASGALFGIFGCLAIIAPEIRVSLLFIPIPMKLTQALIFFTLLDIIFVIMGDPIAISAHLSGAVAGIIMGSWMKKKGQYLTGY